MILITKFKDVPNSNVSCTNTLTHTCLNDVEFVYTYARTHTSTVNEWMNECMHNIFVLGPELNNWIPDIKERRERDGERNGACHVAPLSFDSFSTISYGFLPYTNLYTCMEWSSVFEM